MKIGITREAARLEALRQYNILDTPAEQAYDDITALAAFICNVPIALVSLVDEHRQWFKSKVGLDIQETSRDVSFCAHAILNQDMLIVNDALKDERFWNNPLVVHAPGIRFYAGVPLVSPRGYPIGTLCVIDYQPNQLSPHQQQVLTALARQVVVQLELRRVSSQLAETLDKLELMAGLIPICSYCKGIRNDQGYWSTVEQFMEQHADVEFTHGICDDCMQQHFPEVAQILLTEAEARKDGESAEQNRSPKSNEGFLG